MPIVNSVIIKRDGIQPSGTIEINSNNTYDVTNYASAVVDVNGGDTSDTYVLISVPGKPEERRCYMKGDDWENHIGEEVVLYGTPMDVIAKLQDDDGNMHTAPFTCVSATATNEFSTITFKSSDDYLFTFDYIKRKNNFSIYEGNFGLETVNLPILAPRTPKVGDEIPVYDESGYTRKDLINGTKTLSYYSSENKFFYFSYHSNQRVDGPITVKEVNYTEGKISIRLQDAYGNVLTNNWLTPVEKTQITANGKYDVTNYAEVNVDVQLPERTILFPSAIRLSNSKTYVRNVEKSTPDVYAWNSSNGDMCYTPAVTIDNYSSLTAYDSWTLTNMLYSVNKIFYGGFICNNDFFYRYESDPYETIYRNLSFDDCSVDGYKVPQVGKMVEVWGEEDPEMYPVQESFDSSINMPIAFESDGQIFFYDHYDEEGENAFYYITNDQGDDDYIKKFFAPTDAVAYNHSNIDKIYYLGFYSEEEDSKFVYTNNVSGNLAIFTNGDINVYVNPSNFVENGIFYYDPSDLSNTGTITRILSID